MPLTLQFIVTNNNVEMRLLRSPFGASYPLVISRTVIRILNKVKTVGGLGCARHHCRPSPQVQATIWPSLITRRLSRSSQRSTLSVACWNSQLVGTRQHSRRPASPCRLSGPGIPRIPPSYSGSPPPAHLDKLHEIVIL
jgi:hypothetical protein